MDAGRRTLSRRAAAARQAGDRGEGNRALFPGRRGHDDSRRAGPRDRLGTAGSGARQPGARRRRLRVDAVGGDLSVGRRIEYDASPGGGMRTVSRPAIAAGLFAAALAAGCATTGSSSRAPAAAPRLGELPPYTDADVEFMSGMIAHHAQAVIMAGWAPSHGARKDVAILCERIVVGQRDEIELMQTWLRDRGLP